MSILSSPAMIPKVLSSVEKQERNDDFRSTAIHRKRNEEVSHEEGIP